MSRPLTTTQAQAINRQLGQATAAIRCAANAPDSPTRILDEVATPADLDVYYPSPQAIPPLFAEAKRNASLALSPFNLLSPTGIICLPPRLGFPIPRVPVRGIETSGEVTAVAWANPHDGWKLPVVCIVEFTGPNHKRHRVTSLTDAGQPRASACKDLSCGFCHATYAAQHLISRLIDPALAYATAKVRAKKAPRLPRRLHLIEAQATKAA